MRFVAMIRIKRAVLSQPLAALQMFDSWKSIPPVLVVHGESVEFFSAGLLTWLAA